jgi:hypothetical protein
MQKLVDVFGTKYFTDDWVRDVTQYLNDHKEVDLADARIAESLAITLQRYQYDGYYFTDSLNEYRNALFEENRKRLGAQKITENLPVLDRYNKLPEYIKSFKEGDEFRIQASSPVSLLLGILLQIYRPEVTVDFSVMYGNLFEYVCPHIIWMKTHEKLYSLVGNTFFTVRVDNGKVYIPFTGKVPYDAAVKNYPLIPYDFGNVCLDEDPEWTFLVDRVLFDLENQLETNRRTMKEYCLNECV